MIKTSSEGYGQDKEKIVSMKDREKAACEKLWAAEKYLVLSKSQNSYKQIREYVKAKPNLEQLREMMEAAKALPENRGEGINAFQHIWGYFRKKAEPEEKKMFMELLADYREGSIEQDAVIRYIQDMLIKYPDSYLLNSAIIKNIKN